MTYLLSSKTMSEASGYIFSVYLGGLVMKVTPKFDYYVLWRVEEKAWGRVSSRSVYYFVGETSLSLFFFNFLYDSLICLSRLSMNISTVLTLWGLFKGFAVWNTSTSVYYYCTVGLFLIAEYRALHYWR